MAQTTSKFRVIKDSSIYNNTKCSSYGDDVLMVDTSGGIYLGNETSTPDLIAASPNGTYPNMTVGKATNAERLISDAGDYRTPVYFAYGKPIVIGNLNPILLSTYDASYNRAGGISEIGALLSKQPINILAGLTTDEVICERWSGAKGSSAAWEDVTLSEKDVIMSTFAGNSLQGSSICQSVAYNSNNSVIGDKIRYTILPNDRYCIPRFLYAYFSTDGGTFQITIEYNTWNISTSTYNSDWKIVHENADIRGWSGPNEYSMTGVPNFGQMNASNGYGLRITIECINIHNTYNSKGNIYSLQLFTQYTPYSVANVASDNNLKILGVPYYTRENRNIVLDRGLESKNDIIPFTNEIYNLGDVDHKWDTIYANNFTGKADSAINADKALHAETAVDLTGRVESTPEVFTYRPSAGDKSIKDDNAFIRRVKGNSVVFNQLVKNGDFASAENWVSHSEASTTLTIEGGKAVVTSKYAGTGGDPVAIMQILPPSVANHKYFVSLDFNTNNTDLTPYFEYYRAFSGYASLMFRDGDTYSSIFTAKESGATTFLLKPQGTKAVGDVWEWDNVMVIDLTQMFGAGNEPTTVEEFRALYPDSYYPYNAGELRNLNCYGIKTVGFNQWDGKVEVGYIDDTTGNATANQNYLHTDFIRVIPNQEYYINTEQTNSRWGAWYDANKNYIAGILNYDQVYVAPPTAAYVRLTIKTADSGNLDTFCINLHHTGYRDGEYEPYKEVTHTLPLSQITNGEPLRKAGSVYDEINETEYIKRVGVVDLGSLEWIDVLDNMFACTEIPNMIVTTDLTLRLDGLLCTKYVIDTILSIDATMSDKTMKRNNGYLYIKDTSFTDAASFKDSLSGVLLHYELAEPIVTPIETPIDFNYYVEDFGTEEALLTEDSAPFSADIVYQFNAVDTIRQNNRNIKKLMDDFIYWELY